MAGGGGTRQPYLVCTKESSSRVFISSVFIIYKLEEEFYLKDVDTEAVVFPRMSTGEIRSML